jgi:hypothetical protein
MSLNGVEVAAKISGKAAERLAVLLYAILKDQNKTRGKTRLTNMLKSGKELKVFAIKDNELAKFCTEAKKYGVLYCVLKDTNAGDGLTDIMVRAEDASKVNRIFERFGLATVDFASVKTEIEKAKTSAQKEGEEIPVPDRIMSKEEQLEKFLDVVVAEKENPTAEKQDNQNPSMARTTRSRQSEHSSESKKDRSDVGAISKEREEARPSVRKELKDIRKEQEDKKAKEQVREPRRSQQHVEPPKKNTKRKGGR